MGIKLSNTLTVVFLQMALCKAGIVGIFTVVLLVACLILFIELNSVKFCIFCHKRAGGRSDTFLLLPDIDCRENPPFLVILVTAEPWQLEARAVIRQTWGKERIIEDKRVVSFFLLGTMEKKNKQAEASIISESLKYKDIIQKNFTDSYYNLTLKTLMGIEWVHHFCPQSSFVMKTDSDMFVNTFYLTELLVRKNRTTSFFTGFLKPEEYPIRDKNSKWYVSEIEYPGQRYPSFCSGTGYVFSTDIAKQIYKVSPSVPYFKLEDVYVGLCLDKLRIPPEELHTEHTFFSEKLDFSICRFRKIVTCHRVQPHELLMYWDALQISQDELCPGSDN
ncbi:beta-1,3-galactosyltransferase 5-like [Rhinatrema bivittatum]|uniref:beta-1,3-galactosyltransferase 5-like n=1 Tax=Rhinatrema bivittatum TaxID=194408 RepID=UPI001126346D|nr:beta-1,3-galactosyltransferase 5-like [Rhinatrema bivittatum]